VTKETETTTYTIKPLKWEGRESIGWEIADISFTRYTICCRAKYLVETGDGRSGYFMRLGEFDTIEEAKAVAVDHYVDHVLRCLEAA